MGQESADEFAVDCELVQAVSTASSRNILSKWVSSIMPILFD
jgi:hypothetical protein